MRASTSGGLASIGGFPWKIVICKSGEAGLPRLWLISSLCLTGVSFGESVGVQVASNHHGNRSIFLHQQFHQSLSLLIPMIWITFTFIMNSDTTKWAFLRIKKRSDRHLTTDSMLPVLFR